LDTTYCSVELYDITFRYPDGHLALHGINLTIHQGEKVALVGPNGAGKSTLLLHLNGIHTGEGQVSIDGLSVNHQNIGQVRAKVGLVFQSPDDQLFSPTVFDDVAYGPIYQGFSRDEVEARVTYALDAVGMQGYRQRSPHHLSVGEKKRIAIATVLSMHPSVLVLDEPTSGLDPRARRSLIELLRQLPQTLLVATHDLEMVRELLPRTVVMDQGEIVADGATQVILSDESVLYQHGLKA
jgi:cobalt transport protein ATP-binding subunit